MNCTVRVWKRDGGLHDANGADDGSSTKGLLSFKTVALFRQIDDLAVATEAPWAANKFVKAVPQIARLIFKF